MILNYRNFYLDGKIVDRKAIIFLNVLINILLLSILKHEYLKNILKLSFEYIQFLKLLRTQLNIINETKLIQHYQKIKLKILQKRLIHQ